MGKGQSISVVLPCGITDIIEVAMSSWGGIAFRLKRETLS